MEIELVFCLFGCMLILTDFSGFSGSGLGVLLTRGVLLPLGEDGGVSSDSLLSETTKNILECYY